MEAVLTYYAEHSKWPPRTWTVGELSPGVWLRNQRYARRSAGADGRYIDARVDAALSERDPGWWKPVRPRRPAAERDAARPRARLVLLEDLRREGELFTELPVAHDHGAPSEEERQVIACEWVALSITLTIGWDPVCERAIAVPADTTLALLTLMLCAEFDRWEDAHMYRYAFPGRGYAFEGMQPEIPATVASAWGLAPTLAELDVAPGETFEHIFDFGATWVHQGRIQRIGRELAREIKALVLAGLAGPMTYLPYRSRGTAPEQYPRSDWDDVEP